MAISENDQGVFFDARLTPHRSLSPRGFLILMALIALISFLAGVAFALKGAWPVFGFFGLDAALIFLAFRANYRQARAFETVTLTAQDLLVRRVSAVGKERVWRFEPHWVRIEMDDPPEHDSPLTVTSHGRRLAIGAFLTPEERLGLARALRAALAERRAALVEVTP